MTSSFAVEGGTKRGGDRMTEMEFLHEEEMLRSCLKIHETSARNLREQIGIIQSIKAQLLRQSRGGPKLVHHIPVPCPPKV